MNEMTSGADTRVALLGAARACIRDHGLSGTTSRRITAAAGANLAAITYHFGSKDQLVQQALLAELAERLTPALAVLEGEGPAEIRLLGAASALLGEFERAEAEVPILLEALLAATRPGPLHDEAVAILIPVAERLIAVLGDLRADGIVPPWVDPSAMAGLLMATATGLAVQTRLLPDGPALSTMAGQFVHLLLAAAAPPGN